MAKEKNIKGCIENERSEYEAKPNKDVCIIDESIKIPDRIEKMPFIVSRPFIWHQSVITTQ